ncbi:hypothetical protein LUX33_47315 [Actinomadura madurae]|nr:hypothetical protein [Actinomadura madurae]
MTGISRTRPISKNIGRPISAPTRAIAHGRNLRPDRPTMVSTIWSAPPESASSLPNIAPSAMSAPTPAAVSPNPLPNPSMVSAIGSPAMAPTSTEPSVRLRNGCTLK